MRKRAPGELDDEEREILDRFDRGELVPVPDVAAEIAKHRRYARNSLKQSETEEDKRVAFES